jgi:hypothetical protein
MPHGHKSGADAGASLDVIKCQPTNTHSMERRGTTLSLSNFKF